ncbi:MAG: hypothetical protein M5U28_29710 [Sandaracinaceae bacterium]|nr:hypothetical protein [Sandaracinaceae bacterium]
MRRASAVVRPRVPGTTSARGGDGKPPRETDGMECAARSTAYPKRPRLRVSSASSAAW